MYLHKDNRRSSSLSSPGSNARVIGNNGKRNSYFGDGTRYKVARWDGHDNKDPLVCPVDESSHLLHGLFVGRVSGVRARKYLERRLATVSTRLCASGHLTRVTNQAWNLHLHQLRCPGSLPFREPPGAPIIARAVPPVFCHYHYQAPIALLSAPDVWGPIHHSRLSRPPRPSAAVPLPSVRARCHLCLPVPRHDSFISESAGSLPAAPNCAQGVIARSLGTTATPTTDSTTTTTLPWDSYASDNGLLAT